MKVQRRSVLLIVLPAVLLLCGVLYAVAFRFGHLSFQPPIAHRDEFSLSGAAGYPGRLQADGKRLVATDGRTVTLRGLMPGEPARLQSIGRLNRDFFAGIRQTGANVVRIPVHPEYWVRDGDYLWRYLDPIVRWTGELGMYAIIDWHYIGNIATGEGAQMPDLTQRPRDLSLAFWQATARYFRDAPHVIFEVYNEPASIDAASWQQSATELVQMVRAQGAQQLVIVGGVEYGRELSWVMSAPVADANVAYASHIYPSHSPSGWGTWFGQVSERYPVLITEWGFMDENRNARVSYLSGDRQSYAEPFLAYLHEQQIGWVACWYDSEWEPQMFQAGWKNRTRWGDFVLEQLKKAE